MINCEHNFQEPFPVLGLLVLFPVDKVTQGLTILLRRNVLHAFTQIHIISTLNKLLFRVQLEVEFLDKDITTSPY